MIVGLCRPTKSCSSFAKSGRTLQMKKAVASQEVAAFFSRLITRLRKSREDRPDAAAFRLEGLPDRTAALRNGLVA